MALEFGQEFLLNAKKEVLNIVQRQELKSIFNSSIKPEIYTAFKLIKDQNCLDAETSYSDLESTIEGEFALLEALFPPETYGADLEEVESRTNTALNLVRNQLKRCKDFIDIDFVQEI